MLPDVTRTHTQNGEYLWLEVGCRNRLTSFDAMIIFPTVFVGRHARHSSCVVGFRIVVCCVWVWAWNEVSCVWKRDGAQVFWVWNEGLIVLMFSFWDEVSVALVF